MSNENDDYKVGYGRPPLTTRFEKGRSGNPRGRRKQSALPSISLRGILEELQPVQVGGRRVKMSKGEIFVRKLVERALQGEARSTRMLLEFMAKDGMINRAMQPAFDFAGAKEELERRLMKLVYTPVGIDDSEQDDDGEK